MGLDVVEIVMRTEEVFGITIADADAEQASTVGKLFEFICAELKLPTGTAAPDSPGLSRLNRPLDTRPWTGEEAWATLVDSSSTSFRSKRTRSDTMPTGPTTWAPISPTAASRESSRQTCFPCKSRSPKRRSPLPQLQHSRAQ
jgi:hypothetical protein